MNRFGLVVFGISSILLCGCGETSSINTYQPSINVETTVKNEESTVKKTNKTKTNTKTNSTTKTNQTTTNVTANDNSASIKSLMIDGNGNLVATNSNNTYSIIGPVQGIPGPMGPQGPQGSSGSQGEKGEPGRGIASCNVDSNGDLIITYTDGTTQNAGNVRQEVTVHDYEQVGYVPQNITSSFSGHYTYTNSHGNTIDFDYSIHDIHVELVNVEKKSTYTKYDYEYKFKCDISNYNSTNVELFGGVRFDATNINDDVSNYNGYVPFHNGTNLDISRTFNTSTPITKFELVVNRIGMASE